MSRLADALERANRTPDPAPRPQAPATAPIAHAASPAQPHIRRMQPAPITVPRPAPAATSAHLPAAPLRALPEDSGHHSEWRTDRELAGKLFGTQDFPGAALEQYRKLAATLHHAQSERGIRVIMTASALPGEGKSLTAVNLALTLSESYHKRVLLVDADLRRPTVQRVFGLPAIGGLNEGLKLPEDRAMAVTQISDRLFVLPAGRPEADPMSGLTSDRMRRLVTQAAAAFDWVIIDTPPVGLLPDASLLADFVDGVLLVVRA